MNKKEKCHNTQVNRIVIHLGDCEKRVYENELSDYLNLGWTKGISEKHRNAMSTKRLGVSPWNKGTVGVMHSNKTSFKKGNTYWKLRYTDTSSWNKGLTKYTDPRVMDASIKLKSSWENNPQRRIQVSQMAKQNKGRVLSQETKDVYLQKCYNTRKKNNTFNSSCIEERVYNSLCQVYGADNIQRQYMDKIRYPYRCDFYVTKEDQFIEVNNHWTHGGRPYDPEDPVCQAQLKLWQDKAKTSDFYRNAIVTWTIRDVEKLSYAKKYHLNYKIIYK